MRTVEETKTHNYQCFVEGVSEIAAKTTYRPVGEALSSDDSLNYAHISGIREDNADFYERAGKLPALEAESYRLRMNPRLIRLTAKDTPSKLLALAVQMKKEDNDLQWWRQRVAEMRVKD